MNVSFLNTLYRPSNEKLQELQRLQEIIHYSRVTALYEVKGKSKHETVQRMKNFHAHFRRRWEVISNEIEDLDSDDMNPENNTPLQ